MNRKATRLTKKVRIIFLAVPALLGVAILAVGLLTSRTITDDAARQMSRQYSIESAANFQSFMNPHMLVMQQMSYSITIARWLADEYNLEYKHDAFQAMMGHARTKPYAYFMFTVYDSWKGYNFRTDLEFDDFVSWGQLSGGEASQWFFDARDAENMFILNIQRTRPDEDGNWDLYIWSNHRIYYNDQIVGVFTVGSPFEEVYTATFGGFDVANKRGYIIDRDGRVRLDSAGILETTLDGLPVFPEVPETLNNPQLVNYIDSHLQGLRGGLFPLGTETCDPIGLNDGAFRYASVTPIIGTDWSVMVLSDDTGVFGVSIIPLIIISVVILVFYAMLGNVAMRRILLTPLEKLAQSTVEIGTNDCVAIYGTDRDDEIGYLAQTIKHSQERLVYRERVLNTLNQAAQILLTSNLDMTEAVTKSMEIVGRSVNADRVHLWRNEMVDGELHFVLTYNWLSNAEIGKIVGDLGMSFPYSERPGWLETLNRGESMNGPVSELHPENEAFQRAHGVKSFATVPLFIGNELFGSLSVSDCTTERKFTNEEMEMFASIGLMFVNSLIRNEQINSAKEAQIAEESNRAKSRFLAHMSHELRTPITAVLGLSEIQLRGPKLPQRVEETFTKIHDSSQVLLGIVNDILDFSKIESGKLSLITEEYEVASLISDMADLAYLERGNTEFRMRVDEQLPARLIGDILRIRQIIYNLTTNAFKYTASGFVNLSFGCEKEQSDNITLVITIQDTGFGMTQEQLKVLKTSEYSRFHEREDRWINGTGLGIPIVYSLVQMMDGRIDFNSEVGKGTTVVVRISQQTAESEVLGKETAANLQNFESHTWSASKTLEFVPEPMPYGKVLVVDDVDANIFVARGLLSFYDISVDTCKNGKEAIEKIERGMVYDIVFMDYLMPELNGNETMQIMRNLGYHHPIVALTANAIVGQAEEFIKNGFDGFVSKPIQTLRLDEVLTKFIRDKQPPEVIAEAKAKRPTIPRANRIDDFLSSTNIAEKLRADFVRKHEKTHQEICQYIEKDDFATAHRLAHTLKGSAGLIGEVPLMLIADDIENLLLNKEEPSDDKLTLLENELAAVLENIILPEAAQNFGVMDKNEVSALLNKLEPLLKACNIKCLDFLSDLRMIPEAATLIRQLEDYDFELAQKSMKTLKQIFDD